MFLIDMYVEMYANLGQGRNLLVLLLGRQLFKPAAPVRWHCTISWVLHALAQLWAEPVFVWEGVLVEGYRLKDKW